MRERLIKLLKQAEKQESLNAVCGDIDSLIDSPRGAEFIADYLLENGVVLLPEKVYWFDMGGNLTEAKRIDEFFAETKKGYGYKIAYSEIGKTVFLSREDAEKALRKEDEGK